MIAFPGRMRRTRPLKDTTPHDRNQWLHGSSGWTGKGAAGMPDNARAAAHTSGPTCMGGGTWAFPARPHDRCGGSAGQADKTACHDPPWLHARMQTANALLLPVELQGEEAPCEHQPGYSTGSGKNFPPEDACRAGPSRAAFAAPGPNAVRPPRRRPAWASRAPGPRCRSPRTARRVGGSRGCHQGCRRSSRACRPRRPSSRALRCAAR